VIECFDKNVLYNLILQERSERRRNICMALGGVNTMTFFDKLQIIHTKIHTRWELFSKYLCAIIILQLL